MKTLRYNIYTKSYTLHNGQYKTYDGRNGRIDAPWVQLEVLEVAPPAIDELTQRISFTYDIQVNGQIDEYGINGTATQVWHIEDKTLYEIAMNDWAHPQYLKRIIAPKQLVLDDIGIKMLGWFQINNFPFESKDNTVELYCNVILEEHQQIIESLQGLITIQDRPQP
jgi:hypothetical protein